MFVRHNPKSFMSGDDPFITVTPIESSGNRADHELIFENRHEGFIGIPHGGLGMGLCLDWWRRMEDFSYPVTVRYKFGGSGLPVGAPAIFSVERLQGGSNITAQITKNGDKKPYLKADINPATPEEISHSLPGPPGVDFRELPYYRNCFVCGHHRTEPGLQRRFRVHGSNGSHLTTVQWGADDDDFDRAKLFRFEGDELHPAILVAMFDENTAWGGFMTTRKAALSVRLDMTLLRPVKLTERLLLIGRPTGTRGNPKAPRFFSADGAVLSVKETGDPEPVAHGHGEWIVMDSYTRQIKTNLLPEDDWKWIFGDD